MLFTKNSIRLCSTCCYLVLFLLTACATGTTAPLPPANKNSPSSHVLSLTVSPTRTPKLGAPGCKPPSPIDQSNLTFPEMQGTTPGMDLWAMLLGTPSAMEEGKIIWKIGASFNDPIHIVGIGPHGLQIQPLFLERHTGSNWNRPGEELGTGFKFPVAGCWNLHVIGGSTVGDVWLIIS